MERLCKIDFQPINRTGDLVALTSRCCNLPQAKTLLPHEQAVKDFPLDERSKNWNTLRFVKQSKQPVERLKQRY